MAIGRHFVGMMKWILLALVLVSAAVLSAIGTIRLSLRNLEDTIPALVGLSVEEGQELLRPYRIEVKVEDQLYSEQWEAGRIISQAPSAGSKVKMGQSAYVLVSLGKQTVPIPNLVGKTLRAGQITLFQRNLTLGEVARVYSSGSQANQVLAQEPASTHLGAHRPNVSLLVSLGENPTSFLATDFIGRSLQQAEADLENSGLPKASVTLEFTQATSEGRVLAQIPLPGAKVGRHALFEFRVSTHSPPPNEPAPRDF